MTEAQQACLSYLDDMHFASAHSIGRHLIEFEIAGGSNYIAVGAGIVGSLRKRGFVEPVPDINKWRITDAGRASLSSSKDTP